MAEFESEQVDSFASVTPAQAPGVDGAGIPHALTDPRARNVARLGRAAGNVAVARALRGDAPAVREGDDVRGVPEHHGDGLTIGLQRAVLRRSTDATLARNGNDGGAPPGGVPDGGTPTGGNPPTAATPTAKADEDAKAVHDALDKGDGGTVLERMQGRDDVSRAALSAAFDRAYPEAGGLPGYIRSKLVGDMLVKAFALLTASSHRDGHVELGLALIPDTTRDEALFQILEAGGLAERKGLETRYRKAFGDEAPGGALGKGSLAKDIDDDTSGWRREKLLALLDRDLTQADHLYFNSEGITGTHTAAVVSQIQGAWDGGPGVFAGFVADWNTGPKGKGSGGEFNKPWTEKTLRQSMDDELSGEEWNLVEAVLKAYEGLEAKAIAAEDASGSQQSAPIPDSLKRVDPDVVEDAQLTAAWDSLQAATTGSAWWQGWGTNEEQVNKALATIRKIWLGRIERAQKDKNAEKEAQYRKGWEEAKARAQGKLTDGAISEMSGSELKEAQMTLGADLKDADRFYLEAKRGNYDAAVQIMFDAWKGGRADALMADADKERTFPETGQTRPKYAPKNLMLVNTGDHRERVEAITDYYPDNIRGSALLFVAFHKYGEDGLKQAIEVLNSAPGGATSDIVARYVQRNLGAGEGTAGARLARWVIEKYGAENTTALDFQDLVDPIEKRPKDQQADEYAKRARARVDASKSGVLNSYMRGWLKDYDALTGEDTLQRAEDAAERAEAYAKLMKEGTPEQVALVAHETGKTIDQLAGEAYEELKKRLGDVSAKLHAVSDAIGTALELAIAAAVTAATGGAAAGIFVGMLAGAVAHMLVDEGAHGQNYELASKDNAAKLTAIVAGAALGAFGGSLLEGAEAVASLQKMGRMGAFVKEATTEAFSQLGQTTVKLSFQSRAPSEADIASAALSMLGSVAGAGAGGSVKFGMSDTTPLAQAMRTVFIAQVANGTLQATGELGGEAIQPGADFSGADYLMKIGEKGFKVVTTAMIQTLGEVGAMQQRAAAEAAKRKSEAAADEPGATKPGDPETKPDADGPHGDEKKADGTTKPKPKVTTLKSPDPSVTPDATVRYDLDPLEAQIDYASRVNGNKDLEAAIYYDPKSDTWLVVQGTKDQVGQDWRSLPEVAGRSWQLHKHYHPGPASEARFPSSADFHAIVAQMREAAAGGAEQPVQSIIDYRNEQGEIRYTYYGYRPGEGFFVTFHDPATGKIETRVFAAEPWAAGSDFKTFLQTKGVNDTGPSDGSLAAGKGRVTEPVPGLYDKVDPNRKVAGWKFEDDVEHDASGKIKITTTVTDPHGKDGTVQRSYDPATGVFSMELAFLTGVESKIEGEVGFGAPGEKTPLLAYITMRQMKALGVGYGGLTKVKMSTIHNVVTICELHEYLSKGTPPPDAVVRATASVRYAETTLVQSGHSVVKAKVGGNPRKIKLGVLLDHQANYAGGPLSDPAVNAAAMAKHGLTRDMEVVYDFDIVLETGPFQSAAPGGSTSGGAPGTP